MAIRGVTYNVIDGTSAGETITGTDGPDLVTAKAGDDTVYGGLGNDDLSGQDGDDTLFGGGGNDSIGGNEGEDVLYGEDGDDVLWGVNGGDRIYGGAGRDDLRGGQGNDLLVGGDGDDRMIGEQGSDRLIGGRGDDSYYGLFEDYRFIIDDGRDSAVVNATMAESLLDFARTGASSPWNGYLPSVSTVFVISPDGTDTFNSIGGIEFNDGLVLGYAITSLQVFAAYEMLMERRPDTSEYAFWSGRLVNLGSGNGNLLMRDAILESAEGRAVFAGNVDEAYRMFVGRAATAAEVSAEHSAALSNRDYELSFDAMREHVIDRHQAEVGEMITQTYRAIAGRSATTSEIAVWMDLFGSAKSNESQPWGYSLHDTFATPDTLVNALMSDPGTGGNVLQLRGTTDSDLFVIPANSTNVRITNFDARTDRIVIEGGAYSSADLLDPAKVRQTTDTYLFGGQTSVVDGNVLIELDATHRIIVEGQYGTLDREQYLSRTTDTIDTYYQRHFGRIAMVGEVEAWDDLFAGGATYDTLVDALIKDGAAINVQRLAGTAGADTLALDAGFRTAVVTGFDPAADTLSLRGTAYAGTDPLALAREVTGLDGYTDVLVAFDAAHSLLFDNITLAQLSSSDFLV